MSGIQSTLLSLHRKDAPLFAVLDGAQFDNLPQELMLGGFVSRPLYLDRGENDAQQVITAPHLVWLDETLALPTGRSVNQCLPALMQLIAGRPAVVFWQCPAGGEALYKHLRSINMVRYPKAALDDWEEPELELEEGEEPTPPDTHTMVIFRHADANVLAQVLPALNDIERSRFFGPATLVQFSPAPEWAAGDNGIIAERGVDLPPPMPGPMTLSQETLESIDDGSEAASREVIRGYLREVAPEYLENMSATEVQAVILNAERVGKEIGLESEYAFGLWTYLALITGQEILQEPQVLAHFRNESRPADELVEELVDQIANASDDELEAWT
ncbi:DUF4123 domain-containing protein [uncultured Litoreibacter sp.]|uniref:DUF4123 domain-containing protein n=1 Tax=uncultured Litoreibacter sp. TaxID=1392394 RepID=UPI00262F0F13|nr:DUF4123 domain-containing protein [uncultured Litoreibacter sp.]